MTNSLSRVSKQDPCPICGRPDWCRVAASGRFVICNRVESGEPAKSNGWLHRLSGEKCARPAPRPRPSKAKEARWASPQTVDNAYSRMLERLGLSGKHRADLARRGMTPQEIEGGGYASLRLGGRRELCARLRREGHTLEGVPGFYSNGSGWALSGSPGLLIPVRNRDGRIQGLQIRADNPGDDGKYTWLSSAGRECGTSSGAPAHAAYPTGRRTSSPTWITEGALKADIASHRLRTVVVAVPGVASWRTGLNLAAHIAGRDPGTLVVAFDTDWTKNEHVARYRSDLILTALERGWRVRVATWDAEHKGIDDALTAGSKVSVGTAQVKT